jgi:carbon storage regulator
MERPGVNRRAGPQSTEAERAPPMLVLSRKNQERIVVRVPRATTIVIAVCEIKGDKVRIGVQAPAECTVNREEVQIQLDAEASRRGAT